MRSEVKGDNTFVHLDVNHFCMVINVSIEFSTHFQPNPVILILNSRFSQ